MAVMGGGGEGEGDGDCCDCGSNRRKIGRKREEGEGN
jgi:hypothetical protein